MNEEINKEFDGGNIDINALEGCEPSGGIDLSEFVGKKIAIENVKTEWLKSKFGPNNTTLPVGQEILAPVLKVESIPLTTITNSEGEEIEIRASEMFSLKKIEKDGKTKIGWSTHEKGALNKFLKKMKVSHPNQLKGKIIMVTTRPGKQEGQEFLGFVKE